jgi:hypothetical protein
VPPHLGKQAGSCVWIEVPAVSFRSTAYLDVSLDGNITSSLMKEYLSARCKYRCTPMPIKMHFLEDTAAANDSRTNKTAERVQILSSNSYACWFGNLRCPGGWLKSLGLPCLVLHCSTLFAGKTAGALHKPHIGPRIRRM